VHQSEDLVHLVLALKAGCQDSLVKMQNSFATNLFTVLAKQGIRDSNFLRICRQRAKPFYGFASSPVAN
jgi:hypothetical protein